MNDFLHPVGPSLIGLLLVLALFTVGWRLSTRGPSRIRRALVTIGGSIVALWLFGMVVQACSTPPDGSGVSVQAP